MTAGVCHTGSMARYSATNRRQLLRFRSNGQLHLLEAAGGLRIVAHHVDRLMRAGCQIGSRDRRWSVTTDDLLASSGFATQMHSFAVALSSLLRRERRH